MNKNKLIQVFDNQASDYDKYRPRYPDALIEELIDLSQIENTDKILEFGCGSGQLTIELIKRGFNVTAVEKGAALSSIARRKIKKYGVGEIVNCDFTQWQSIEKFRLFVAAQSFHWMDKKDGINRIENYLEKEGSIGLIWNIDESQDTEFWQETNVIYQKYMPLGKGQKSTPENVNDIWAYLQTRTQFCNFQRREFKWEKWYSGEDYLGLLKTFSGHMTLELTKRERFFSEMTSIIQRFNNRVLRKYRSVLLYAEKQAE